ncbi:hypothetical protein EYF80_030805 [Liparis tanakae]|uniref:Uncharacterized protein n=1 Tax=Liparis tanakae TaxID=230148 RepID=A0A4Z2H060_9TELE|nr:hypothetical protein EYF80_030805 [Liparis tanakae]
MAIELSSYVNHSHVVAKGGREARPEQSVLHQQSGGGVALLLQQDHRPAVIGSGGSGHHCEATVPGDAVPRIEGES